MREQTLRDLAVQKSLTLSEQDALKVLIFIAGMDAGAKLSSSEIVAEENRLDLKESNIFNRCDRNKRLNRMKHFF